jgi:glycosyltransferase involved in cell wall biosynthesis
LATALLTAACHSPRTAAVATKRPVRVCFLIDSLSRAGTETQLVALVRGLDRSRVEPTLCLLRDKPEQANLLEPEDCRVLRLGVYSFRQPTLPLRMARFVRFLRRERIDALQVHFPDSTYFGVLCGWLARVPAIIRTRNNLGYSLTPWGRRLGRLCNRVVYRTIANCVACRTSLLADEGPSPESVIVLENGVDLARFLEVPRVEERTGPPRVGMVGNLRPVKNPGLLVRAAAEVCRLQPRTTFAIAGEGNLRPILAQQIRQLGLSYRFQLAGARADVPGFLADLDVAVLCSRSEGMSNAALEYMAAGRPIVATAVGGNVELIDDGVTGLLVPSDNAGALASAIQRLLTDRSFAARLGAAARRRAIERFSREAMVRRFENFYESLPGSRS